MRRALLFMTCMFATLVAAQTPPQTAPQPTPQPAPTAGYTPPPVATTYRPLAGKLFFTDAERERLDKARRDGVQIVDSEIVPRSPRIDGFVRSSGGRTTYWVDGRQRIAADPTKDISAGAAMTGAEPTITFRETQATTKDSPSPNTAAIKSARPASTPSAVQK